MLEHHRSSRGGARQGNGGRSVLNPDGLVQQFTNALQPRQAGLNERKTLSHLAQGIEQPLGIEHKGHQRAQNQGVADHQPAAHTDHQSNGRNGHPLKQGGNGGVQRDGPHGEPPVAGHTGGGVGAVVGLTTKHLHHLQPLEVFLQIRIEAAQLFPHPIVGPAVTGLQRNDSPRHRDQGEQQQQAQPPVHQQHGGANHQQ